MDTTLLIALAAIVLLVILSITIFVLPKNKKVEEPKARVLPQRVQQEGGVARRAQVARNQRARLRANASRQQQQDNSDDDVGERPAGDVEVAEAEVDNPDFEKLGAKKRAKLEAKAERKAQRNLEEQSREDRKRKAEAAELERRKENEKEAADEKLREEEEKKAREEQERKDHEEYLKMKEAFSVEDEGYDEDSKDEENLLQEFVRYIKENKVVILEDVAAYFKMKTQAVIDRIQDLQKDGILTGVIDDRGKYIYISQQELEAVAKFIRQRGRISIAELAESSNQLIHLTT